MSVQTTHLLEAPVHDLQLLPGELGVSTQRVQPLRLVAHHLHLQVINVMICNTGGKHTGQSAVEAHTRVQSHARSV